ncbi:hypothetical protein PHISP_03332 [Aspergillus sp. HF37]|nr:hypothetical protein PHISP_03332 [Aspergillus sp. HF37]
MPINWNTEAEAKLFLGVLAQLKNANLKLDYKVLAEYMGPECSVPAVKQRVQKLRRDAESQPSGDGNGAAAPATSPAGGGQKRKNAGGGGRKAGGGKMAKVDAAGADGEEGDEE